MSGQGYNLRRLALTGYAMPARWRHVPTEGLRDMLCAYRKMRDREWTLGHQQVIDAIRVNLRERGEDLAAIDGGRA